jgi:hypothetical protein
MTNSNMYFQLPIALTKHISDSNNIWALVKAKPYHVQVQLKREFAYLQNVNTPNVSYAWQRIYKLPKYEYAYIGSIVSKYFETNANQGSLPFRWA